MRIPKSKCTGEWKLCASMKITPGYLWKKRYQLLLFFFWSKWFPASEVYLAPKKNWIQFSFHKWIFVLQSLYLFFKTVLKYSILDRQYWHMSNLRTSNNRDFFLPKKLASCIPFSQKIWKKLFFISWNYSCMSTHVKIRRQGCVNTNFNGLETLSAWLASEAFQRLNLQRCEILRPPDDLCLMSTMFSTSVFTGAWNKQHQKFSFTCKNMKSPGLKLLPSNKMLLLLSVWWNN